MEGLLAIAFGIILTGAVYLILARNLMRVALGLILLGNAVNLALFLAGRLAGALPPIVAEGSETLSSGAANPLPQALILTAIVIGFALIAFLVVLVGRTHRLFGTLDGEVLREAEPAEEPPPPQRKRGSLSEEAA